MFGPCSGKTTGTKLKMRLKLPAIQMGKPYDPLGNDKGETTTTATNTTITPLPPSPPRLPLSLFGVISVFVGSGFLIVSWCRHRIFSGVSMCFWFWKLLLLQCSSRFFTAPRTCGSKGTQPHQDPTQSSFCKSSAVSAKPGRQAQDTSRQSHLIYPPPEQEERYVATVAFSWTKLSCMNKYMGLDALRMMAPQAELEGVSTCFHSDLKNMYSN